MFAAAIFPFICSIKQHVEHICKCVPQSKTHLFRTRNLICILKVLCDINPKCHWPYLYTSLIAPNFPLFPLLSLSLSVCVSVSLFLCFFHPLFYYCFIFFFETGSCFLAHFLETHYYSPSSPRTCSLSSFASQVLGFISMHHSTRLALLSQSLLPILSGV
jgi:hypothetical protein